MTPDPSELAYGDITNPQSLNLYAYGLNNPLSFSDPSGLTPCQYPTSSNGTSVVDVDGDANCVATGGTPYNVITNITVTATPADDSFGYNPCCWL